MHTVASSQRKDDEKGSVSRLPEQLLQAQGQEQGSISVYMNVASCMSFL